MLPSGEANGRVVALVDMDCFYVQVEQRLRPELYGKPVVLSQVTSSSSPGVILSVSYEARKFGISRSMSVPDACRQCPGLIAVTAPIMENIHKVDLARYRSASEEVFRILDTLPNVILEKASIDEAYLDLTNAIDARFSERQMEAIINELIEDAESIFPSTFIANGNDLNQPDECRLSHLRGWIETHCRDSVSQLRLALGARLVEEIRRNIHEKTSFQCSAGIGPNKAVAKLICSRHKPNKQTIISPPFIPEIYSTTSILSVRNLGGKLGNALCTAFEIKTMGQLSGIPLEDIKSRFPNNAKWIHDLANGIDAEPIKPRLEPKSIAVSKNFPGKNALTTAGMIEKWVQGLAVELSKRLFDDNVKFQRLARNLVVGFSTTEKVYPTKTFPLPDYKPSSIGTIVYGFLEKNRVREASENQQGESETTWQPPISHISMSAGAFKAANEKEPQQITRWFSNTPVTDFKITAVKDDDNLPSGQVYCDEDDDVLVIEDECSRASTSVTNVVEKEEPNESSENRCNSDDDIMIVEVNVKNKIFNPKLRSDTTSGPTKTTKDAKTRNEVNRNGNEVNKKSSVKGKISKNANAANKISAFFIQKN